MPSIVVRVKPNQITIQDTQQELLPHGENAVDLAAGERGVEEEANLDVLLGVANLLAQHLGQQHQVVVVHPDEVAILHVLGHLLGEEAVDVAVRGPRGLVERDLAGVVVEEGPEDGVW